MRAVGIAGQRGSDYVSRLPETASLFRRARGFANGTLEREGRITGARRECEVLDERQIAHDALDDVRKTRYD